MNWTPLWLSLQVATLATLIGALVGVGLAALLARPRLPGKNLLDALITLPLVLPPTVVGYFLLMAAGERSGFGQIWKQLFGTTFLFTFKAVVIAAAIASLPLIVKAARAAIEEVDPNLVRAARTLGASPLRAFLTVTIPLAGRGIIAGLMLGFARALGEFGMALMVGGMFPETETAAINIYQAWTRQDETQMAGMVIALTTMAILLMWGVNHLTRKQHDR